MPAAHAVHVVLPSSLVLSPAAHSLQVVWSVVSVYVFCAQSSHSVMPSSLPYLPGIQGRQMAWPVSFWCWPDTHLVQVSEAAASAPLTHPRGHTSHFVAPLALNLPAAQAVHVVLPEPLVLSPALQALQLVWSVASVYVFCAQSSHSVMPCWSPYLPGTQGRQMAWPVLFWCWPVAHLVQVSEA